MRTLWLALAPIVRWPLQSKARFFTIAALATIGVFIAGSINGNDTAPAFAAASVSPNTTPSAEATPPSANPWVPTAAPSPTSTPGAAGTAVGAGVDGDDGYTDAFGEDPASSNPTAAASDAAAAFVSAWARPDLAKAAWSARVRPIVTPDLWSAGLELTDPANVPQVTVSGEPKQVAINAEEGVFDVPTTGPWVRVHVTYDEEQHVWLVSNVEPVES